MLSVGFAGTGKIARKLLRMSEPGQVEDDSLRGNIQRLLWLNGAWMFLLVMPVVVPWFRGHGLDMAQVYELQAIFAIAIALLEVPSGYISDLLGRRRTLLLAATCNGLAFSWLALADGYWGFVVFELIAALGASLWSGTDVALLYDTLEATQKQKGAGSNRYMGQRLLFSQGGETLAALACAGLSLVSLALPVALNALTAWLPLLLCLGLVEPPRGRMDPATHLENLRWIGRVLWRENLLLRQILLALIAYGLATLLAVWAFQGFWQDGDIPLAWFGILWGGYNLMVALTGKIAHQVEERIGAPATLWTIAALPVIGYAGMGLWGGWIGVAFGLAFQVSRGLTQVVIKDAMNTRVPTEMRATANSVSSLGVRLAFALLGPLMGRMIDEGGYRLGFGVFAGLYVVVALLTMGPLTRSLQQIRARDGAS